MHTLIIMGKPGQGKTLLIMALLWKLAVAYKTKGGLQIPYFIKTGAWDTLVKTDGAGLMRPYVPFTIDDFTPNRRPRAHHEKMSIDELKKATMVQTSGGVETVGGRGSDISIKPHQFRAFSSNAGSVREWFIELDPGGYVKIPPMHVDSRMPDARISTPTASTAAWPLHCVRKVVRNP